MLGVLPIFEFIVLVFGFYFLFGFYNSNMMQRLKGTIIKNFVNPVNMWGVPMQELAIRTPIVHNQRYINSYNAGVLHNLTHPNELLTMYNSANLPRTIFFDENVDNLNIPKNARQYNPDLLRRSC